MVNNKSKATVMVVDDEEFFRVLLGRILAAAGYRVQQASTGWQALSLIAMDPPDLVLLDYSLVGETGLDILKKVKAQIPGVPVVMVTGQDEAELAASLIKAGASDYLAKPFQQGRLLEVVRGVLG